MILVTSTIVRNVNCEMSKELIDRIQELLLIVSAQRDEIRDLKREIKDLVEEVAEMRQLLDNHEY